MKCKVYAKKSNRHKEKPNKPRQGCSDCFRSGYDNGTSIKFPAVFRFTMISVGDSFEQKQWFFKQDGKQELRLIHKFQNIRMSFVVFQLSMFFCGFFICSFAATTASTLKRIPVNQTKVWNLHSCKLN